MDEGCFRINLLITPYWTSYSGYMATTTTDMQNVRSWLDRHSDGTYAVPLHPRRSRRFPWANPCCPCNPPGTSRRTHPSWCPADDASALDCNAQHRKLCKWSMLAFTAWISSRWKCTAYTAILINNYQAQNCKVEFSFTLHHTSHLRGRWFSKSTQRFCISQCGIYTLWISGKRTKLKGTL